MDDAGIVAGHDSRQTLDDHRAASPLPGQQRGPAARLQDIPNQVRFGAVHRQPQGLADEGIGGLFDRILQRQDTCQPRLLGQPFPHLRDLIQSELIEGVTEQGCEFGVGLEQRHLPGCGNVAVRPVDVAGEGQQNYLLQNAPLRLLRFAQRHRTQILHLLGDEGPHPLRHIAHHLLLHLVGRSLEGDHQILMVDLAHQYLDPAVGQLRQQVEVDLDHCLQPVPVLETVLAGDHVLRLLQGEVSLQNLRFARAG